MFDGRDVIYVYDGSFEGLLTAVFTSYEQKTVPLFVVEPDCFQPTFETAVVTLRTDEAKAARVLSGIEKKLGAEVLETVEAVFLSCDAGRATKLLHFLRYAFEAGRGALGHLANKHVLAVSDIMRSVMREKHAMMEFIRFSEMQNGVFFACIHPKHRLVPLLMDHFVDRFNIQPFIIYDETHEMAGIYDTKETLIADARGLRLQPYAAGEEVYRSLWRTFYDAIAIKERTNPNLRRNHLPKRFWRDMLELNDSCLVGSRGQEVGDRSPPRLWGTPPSADGEVARASQREVTVGNLGFRSNTQEPDP